MTPPRRALAYGLGVPLDGAPAALAAVGPAFGRLERITAGDRQVVLGFAKNPTSYNATCGRWPARSCPATC